MRRFITLIVSFSLFVFSSVPFIKSAVAKPTNTMISIQSTTPLYLQYADEAINNSSLAGHWSHSSHSSHASHSSHFSSKY